MKAKLCASCGNLLPSQRRSDHRYCGVRCRVRAHRLRHEQGTRPERAFIDFLERELSALRKINARQARQITDQDEEIAALVGACTTAQRVPTSLAEAMREAKAANQRVDKLLLQVSELEAEKAKQLRHSADAAAQRQQALDTAREEGKKQAETAFAKERQQWQAKVAAVEESDQAARNAVAHLAAQLRKQTKTAAAPVPAPAPAEPPWRDALSASVQEELRIWEQVQQRKQQLGLVRSERYGLGPSWRANRADLIALRRRILRAIDVENDTDPPILWTEARCRLDDANEKLLLSESAKFIENRQRELVKYSGSGPGKPG